jgi:hypothetical protein
VYAKEKFTADERLFYPDVPTEEVKAICEQTMNIAIMALINTTDAGLKEDDFWLLLETAVKVYKLFDSEEME